MLALLRERPRRDRAVAVDRVAAAAGDADGLDGRDVVSLVHDEDVEGEPPRRAWARTSAYTSRSSRCARSDGSHAMLTITRGNSRNGLAFSPWLRRTWAISSLLTIAKSRPNFSRISSCHFSDRLGGQTTITADRARWRSSSSWMTSPASIVLPRPTSSASSRLVRGTAARGAAVRAGRPRRCAPAERRLVGSGRPR